MSDLSSFEPYLELDRLHESLSSPSTDSMNFLNEVAQRFPDAISFAAGRPFEGFFDVDLVHHYLETYRRYLTDRLGGDEVAVRRQILQYGWTKGIINELISTYLELDEGIKVDPASIVVTVGCQEALYLVLRALRRTPQDVLLAVVPCYVGLFGAAQLAEMPVLPVQSSTDGVDFEDLAAVVRRAKAEGLRPRACYVIPDFSNPSGTSLSADARTELLRLACEEDFLILEDDPYGTFEVGQGPLALKGQDENKRVIFLGTFAKTGIPGARVGFVVADQRVFGPDGTSTVLADQLSKIKSMLTVNTSPIAQAVIGGKLLAHGCSLRAANTRETQTYLSNLDQVLQGLAERFPAESSPLVTWNSPTGGFFCQLSLPFEAGDELLELSAQKYRVLWTPIHHFYAERQPRRQIRLSFSHLVPSEIDEGLDRLSSFIHDHAAALGVGAER